MKERKIKKENKDNSFLDGYKLGFEEGKVAERLATREYFRSLFGLDY